ncbi:Spectinomycin tetracycline efflux pump [Nocardia africana]|uniref:Spectinomycin tetracycline efflux pump n=2 Tax=Nocardia africana TaxID=134964 RepID=A0A378X3G9_9NOCA|nr:Spectinomycin tetracycline efflux pump [Nocardia africana]
MTVGYFLYMYRKYSPRVALAAIAVAQLMIALDMAVVNVALPAVRRDLGFTPIDLSWVVHVYALTFGGFLLLGGRAGDLFGRRRLFVLGLFGFALASLAGGLAQQPWQLIAARAVQGVAAATVAPATLAMLTVLFPHGPARVRAFGLWSAANGAGGALGVLLGGVLTEYAGWRWVMLINLPIAALALGLGLFGIPADRRDGMRPPLDIAGALTATGGAGLLVLAVVRTDRYGWLSPVTGGTVLAALLLLAAFVWFERRAAVPLVRLSLLRNRWVAGADLVIALAAAGQFSAFYFVSLYMQQSLGMSAAATGLAFVPFSAGVVAGTVIATRFGDGRSPRALLIPGSLLAAAGLGWFALLDAGGGFAADVLGPSLVTSIGFGLCLAPLAAAATTGVAPTEAGMASGLMNSARQVGGAIGLAALATIAAQRTGSAETPQAVTAGYATGLAIGAALLLGAAVVAAVVLPRRAAIESTRLPAPAPVAAE